MENFSQFPTAKQPPLPPAGHRSYYPVVKRQRTQRSKADGKLFEMCTLLFIWDSFSSRHWASPVHKARAVDEGFPAGIGLKMEPVVSPGEDCHLKQF